MPRSAVIICASPRTGSTLLCNALARTGLCGAPEEYFEPTSLQTFAKEWHARNHRELVKSMVTMTSTPNGVFGIKVHSYHLGLIRAHVQMRTRPWRRRQPNPFVYFAPQQHFVLINRRDKLRQAVSLYRALLTQQWSLNPDKPRRDDPVELDIDKLDELIRRVEHFEARWRQFFMRAQVTPLELTYEDDLEVSHGDAALRVLDAAGIDRPRDLLPAGNPRQQRDAWSEAVVNIYLHAKSRPG